MIYGQFSANFKDILNNSNKLCIYDEFSTYFKNFLCIYGQFQVSLKPFFLRGEIRYTPSERREERKREKQPCGKGREKRRRSGYRQDPVISTVQAAHRYISLTAKGKEYGTRKTQIYDGQASPSQTSGAGTD